MTTPNSISIYTTLTDVTSADNAAIFSIRVLVSGGTPVLSGKLLRRIL